MANPFEQIDKRTEYEGFEVPEAGGEPLLPSGEVWGATDPDTGEDIITPFTANPVRGKESVEELHSQRSKKERIADESFDAELTSNVDKWAKNPDQYDYPGVDTVSPRIRQQRAEKALEKAEDKAYVEESVLGEAVTRGSTQAGVFKPSKKELRVLTGETRSSVGQTMAHEVGHSIDYGEDTESEKYSYGLADDEFEEELREASKYVRGGYSKESGYRGRKSEQFADFTAALVTSPRKTRSEFPELSERVESELDFFD